MKTIWEQIRQRLIIGMMMLFCISPAIAQVKHLPAVQGKHSHRRSPASGQLKEFYHLAADAGVTFVFPKGFKETKAPDDEDFSFDYAMELPGKDFEIWFQVKSEKENWLSYIRSQINQTTQLANPDSLYKDIAAAQAAEFTGDKKYFIRNIPREVLARYNADAGKSYLLTLLDLPETKQYKYALLITLQKNHTGTILAVCFTNDKGPEFFKNMSRASKCLKFKP